MDNQFFTESPIDFAPGMEVAGCYCEFEDTLLFVKRHPDKPYGETWGIPSGKLESQESPREAIHREVFEEVGLEIDDTRLEEIGILYVRIPHLDLIYHIFHARFDTHPTVTLALEEHLEAKWVTLAEALNLPLIVGGKEALLYYKSKIGK